MVGTYTALFYPEGSRRLFTTSHNYPLPLTHRLLYCTLFHTQTFIPIDVSATQKIIKPLEIVTSDLNK